MNKENELHAYSIWGSANAPFIIGCMEDFRKRINEPSVVIFDNAPIHKTLEFQAKIEEWKEDDLYTFFLPTYSPHLNLIETLWRKIKYEWLQPKDYENLQTLEAAIDNILTKFGREFTIDFS